MFLPVRIIQKTERERMTHLDSLDLDVEETLIRSDLDGEETLIRRNRGSVENVFFNRRFRMCSFTLC
jgi:hypothetical protein